MVCPFPAPTLTGDASSEVHLKAPSSVGTGYTYTLFYSRTLAPVGVDDRQHVGRDIDGGPVPTRRRDEYATDAPPAGRHDGRGRHHGRLDGRVLGLRALTRRMPLIRRRPASPRWAISCRSARRRSACSVTDSGGMTDAGSFNVTVVDTTAPQPGERARRQLASTTSDPTGPTLTYKPPTATDVVDASPDRRVQPRPAAPTSASARRRSRARPRTRRATRRRRRSTWRSTTSRPHGATAIWGEPVAGLGDTFSANRGPNDPGQGATCSSTESSGRAATPQLRLTPCGGVRRHVERGAARGGGGRWNASLDTSTLTGGCYRRSLDRRPRRRLVQARPPRREPRASADTQGARTRARHNGGGRSRVPPPPRHLP